MKDMYGMKGKKKKMGADSMGDMGKGMMMTPKKMREMAEKKDMKKMMGEMKMRACAK